MDWWIDSGESDDVADGIQVLLVVFIPIVCRQTWTNHQFTNTHRSRYNFPQCSVPCCSPFGYKLSGLNLNLLREISGRFCAICAADLYEHEEAERVFKTKVPSAPTNFLVVIKFSWLPNNFFKRHVIWSFWFWNCLFLNHQVHYRLNVQRDGLDWP